MLPPQTWPREARRGDAPELLDVEHGGGKRRVDVPAAQTDTDDDNSRAVSQPAPPSTYQREVAMEQLTCPATYGPNPTIRCLHTHPALQSHNPSVPSFEEPVKCEQ